MGIMAYPLLMFLTAAKERQGDLLKRSNVDRTSTFLAYCESPEHPSDNVEVREA